MDQYSASRNTVRDAIKLLTTRGLVETRPGQGTFVVEKINPFVTTLTGDPDAGGGEADVYLAEVGTPAAVGPPAAFPEWRMHEAASPGRPTRCGSGSGDQVVSRHQQRFIGRDPLVPPDLLLSDEPGRARARRGSSRPPTSKEGTVAYLGKLGIKQVGYRDSIAVRAPDDREQAFFKLPADGRVPVFEIFQVDFRDNGSRFRLTVTVYPSDRNRFLIKVGDVPGGTAVSSVSAR